MSHKVRQTFSMARIAIFFNGSQGILSKDRPNLSRGYLERLQELFCCFGVQNMDVFGEWAPLTELYVLPSYREV
jgi:hypothetical protein